MTAAVHPFVAVMVVLALSAAALPVILVARDRRQAGAEARAAAGAEDRRAAPTDRAPAGLTGRRPTGILLGLLVVVIGGATAAGRLGGGGSPAPSVTEPRERSSSARSGVCEAAALARGGDAEGARRAFFDRAHRELHELAASAAASDRAATARLLEAKATVESAFELGRPSLAGDLAALGTATGQAMAAAGGTDPGACP